MSELPSPRQVVEALVQGVSAGAWQDLHKWYSEDATVEYPFALPSPSRLEGLGAIRSYFAAAAKFPLKLTMRNMTIHETTDPEVVVAEWDYDVLAASTGRAFQVSNIQVSRVRDGKIMTSRDYHNHAVLADAMGLLPSVVASLTDTGNPT